MSPSSMTIVYRSAVKTGAGGADILMQFSKNVFKTFKLYMLI